MDQKLTPSTKFRYGLDELSQDQAGNLEHLIEKADFFHLPEELVSKPPPDEYTYTITVETTVSQHIIRFSDTSISDSIRPLYDNLSILARSGGRRQ